MPAKQREDLVRHGEQAGRQNIPTDLWQGQPSRLSPQELDQLENPPVDPR